MSSLQNSYLTIDDIRHALMDRTPDDNEIEFDLAFTDEEIAMAMRHAAMAFNTIPPIGVMTPDPAKLPACYTTFLDGTIAQLYTTLLAKMRRNDMDYTSGGVSANIVQKRIQHLERAREEHRQAFKESARDLKITYNLSRIGGRVG